MFQVDPNIHYNLIAHFPRDPNWDNSVNRLWLNLRGLKKHLRCMSNLLLYSDNLSPTSIIQEWTVAEGRRDQMGREKSDMGRNVYHHKYHENQERGWNKKEIPSWTIHEDLKTDVNLILIPFSIFPHTLFLLISNSSKDLSKQSLHFTPAPPAPSQNSIIQQEPWEYVCSIKMLLLLSSTFTPIYTLYILY